jgi:hypothetical protein
MRRRTRLWAASAVVCAMAMTGACASKESAPAPLDRPPSTIEPPFEGAAVLPPADLTDDGPGSLLEVTPLVDMPEFEKIEATGVRVIYRSTDAKGGATTVSGVVVVPPGKPPRGGWPIVSLGHDATGVRTDCAPSLAPGLGSYSAIMAAVAGRGYVVAMTDYQGLGVDGFRHPMLDSVALGNNMIDVVRAARHVLPSASNRWAAMGVGQGGLAAWGADEQAARYGTGLDLVGAVALSPLADLTGLADAAENGTLTPAQYRLQMLVVASLAISPDSKINPDDYFSDNAKDTFGYLTNCAVVNPLENLAAATRLVPGDLKPKTPSAAKQLHDFLQGFALPTPSALSAPLLVEYATSDPFLPPEWIDRAVQTACGRGEQVQVVRRIGDLSVLNDIALYDAVAWLQGRFAGQHVTDACVA